MSRTITFTQVAPRYRCSASIRRFASDKDFGIITDVKMVRVGFMTWALEFKTEVKV